MRLESKAGKSVEQKISNPGNRILELTGGDQLEKENIEQALANTAANLKSLHRSSNVDLGKSSELAQLYFGPGFEDRLEIELDE